MTLIKSISGIRGTIGGLAGEGLSPLDIVKFTAGYARWLHDECKGSHLKVVVGRDARLSGEMVQHLVIGTLQGMGCDVVAVGLATTPTTELAVSAEKAQGGIILTASHNPGEWNALKLLNASGEFLSADEGKKVLLYAQQMDFPFASTDRLGAVTQKDYTDYHIQNVLNLDLVDCEAIRGAGFSVAFDAINSVGGIILPLFLQKLGVKTIMPINGAPDGQFAHHPEPVPANLISVCETVKLGNVDVCFVVDPDVDRLAIISENGEWFNEEYTLVAVADYVLSKTPGNTVSNLSSTRALRDITLQYGGNYEASAVGEVNVVRKMKATGAVIGGEGNGGVIYPAAHYGRDALVGIALFLSHLALQKKTCSELRGTYPDYFISKNKLVLTPEIDVDQLFRQLTDDFRNEQLTTVDGVKIDFPDGWVHLRQSNTEPIIRVYSEAVSQEKADNLAGRIMKKVQMYLGHS